MNPDDTPPHHHYPPLVAVALITGSFTADRKLRLTRLIGHLTLTGIAVKNR
jgi:hypothetical protein